MKCPKCGDTSGCCEHWCEGHRERSYYNEYLEMWICDTCYKEGVVKDDA